MIIKLDKLQSLTKDKELDVHAIKGLTEGDYLVFRVPPTMSTKEIKYMIDILNETFPPEVKRLVIPNSVDLQVLTVEDDDRRDKKTGRKHKKKKHKDKKPDKQHVDERDIPQEADDKV